MATGIHVAANHNSRWTASVAVPSEYKTKQRMRSKGKKKSSCVQIQGTCKETPKSSHLDITVILNNRKEPSGRHRKGEWKQMKSLGGWGGGDIV